MAYSLLTSLIIFCLFSLSSSLPSQTILDAAEILSDSGYVSMSLTLELVSQTLLPKSPSATLVRCFRRRIYRIRSPPVGAKIPTMFANHSLIVTSALPILKFRLTRSPSPNAGCTDDAIASSGGFRDGTKVTVLAPADEVMMDRVGNFSNISSSIFLRHVLPCKVSWSDLVNFDDGSMLPTSLEGFTINIIRSGDTLKLNEVSVAFPDMYYSDWLVVHGLGEVLTLLEGPEQAADSSSQI
ncbi:putative fasciclin-like arabinogalactan protein 20 [Vitis vinifera]|uniref:Putative fasciclin-like arabinogalactan protein 20 n=1 Tax=Vitis vinifera TaxID=29760 RepID=A0A438C197_VITVI|nr:putative fasciclin-like arabinogalactan protein 20 [Vitis vinifera]